MARLIKSSWNTYLKEEFSKPYFKKLMKKVNTAYKNKTVYPKRSDLFRAFELCSLLDTKVVILGQDPYYRKGQANGLAFSVNKGIKLPPSLKNIYKEMEDDLGIKNVNGDLTKLAKQGVLLLNTTLTVESGKPTSHSKYGWQTFTDAVIKLISDERKHVVFILWGSNAISKEKLIDTKKHLVIKSAHPSPLSAYNGFFGSKPFSKTNGYLVKHFRNSINWKV